MEAVMHRSQSIQHPKSVTGSDLALQNFEHPMAITPHGQLGLHFVKHPSASYASVLSNTPRPAMPLFCQTSLGQLCLCFVRYPVASYASLVSHFSYSYSWLSPAVSSTLKKPSYHPLVCLQYTKKPSYHPLVCLQYTWKPSYHPLVCLQYTWKPSYHPLVCLQYTKKPSYHPLVYLQYTKKPITH